MGSGFDNISTVDRMSRFDWRACLDFVMFCRRTLAGRAANGRVLQDPVVGQPTQDIPPFFIPPHQGRCRPVCRRPQNRRWIDECRGLRHARYGQAELDD